MAIEKTWQATYAKLKSKGKNKWLNTKGPLAAVISTLMDIGWDPAEPTLWQDFEGAWWNLDPTKPHMAQQLCRHLQGQLRMHIWQRAATHNYGKGLEQGVDWTTSRRHQAHWEKRGEASEAGMHSCVAQGAMWCAERRYNIFGSKAKLQPRGSEDTPKLCSRCHGSISSWAHDVWECPNIKQLDTPAIQASNHLCDDAAKGVDAVPSLWLRGLVPYDWTWGKASQHTTSNKVWASGCLLQAPFQVPPGAVAATDGAGAKTAQTPG
jgi:hypothetical protein